jgi:hypothetical protein
MAGRMCSVSRESSGDIDELISIEERQAKIRQCAAAVQKLLAHSQLDGLGRPGQGQLVRAPQLNRAIISALAP